MNDNELVIKTLIFGSSREQYIMAMLFYVKVFFRRIFY